MNLTAEQELNILWSRQKSYNDRIRIKSEQSKEEWTQTYILGLMTEFDELLREINWKKHRKLSGRDPDLVNIAFELADIMKYTISLWEVWGFKADDMLNYCNMKSNILEVQEGQDQLATGAGTNILVTDLDGTVADWRGSFIKWLRENHVVPMKDDPVTSLSMDVDLEMRYPLYNSLKEQFEREGNYATLLPYMDAISTVNNLVFNKNAFVIAHTARPFGKYKRIWMDTWNWIRKYDLLVNQLNMSSESRILSAEFLSRNSSVIMFEDDPDLMVRAANCGIRVFARKHPYNEKVIHTNITFVEKYTDLTVDDYFPERG